MIGAALVVAAATADAGVAEARERALSAVLEVRTAEARGTGVVFHSPSHVLTSIFTIEEGGAPIAVVDRAGTARAAEVVAWDDESGAALLQLDGPVAAAPFRRGRPATCRWGPP